MAWQEIDNNEVASSIRSKINNMALELYKLIDEAEDIKDYNNLQNIPQINGVPLKGDMTLQDIGILELTDAEIQKIFDEITGV